MRPLLAGGASLLHPRDPRVDAIHSRLNVCVLCQQDLERSGMFVKSRIEIYQDIVGWSLEGINQKIITGGRKA